MGVMEMVKMTETMGEGGGGVNYWGGGIYNIKSIIYQM